MDRWERLDRQLSARPTVLLVSSVLTAAAVVETVVRSTRPGVYLGFVLVALALAVASTAPLALDRPLLTPAVVTAANLLLVEPFQLLSVAGAMTQLLVLYRLGRSSLLSGAAAAPFVVLALLPDRGPAVVALAGLAPLAAWAGAATQARRQTRAQVETLEVLDVRLMEHSARTERARIARELHDVVAHHISMISVQTESARLTTPDLPAAGARQLSAIGDTARAALTEMRRLLGVLREDTDGVERRPQPGLGQLNDLLDEARASSGSGARLILSGAPRRLDPGVELAVYRIAQEALTNARRHAPGSAVDVELRYFSDRVRLRIRDNGPGPANSTAPGLGLLGMRERAAAVGGRVTTGPAAGGGFLVESILPAPGAAT